MTTFDLQEKQTRKHMTCALMALTLASPLELALAEEWHGNIGGMIGQTQLKDSDWGSQSRQDAVGLIADFGAPSWPFSLSVDFMGHGDEGNTSTHKNEAYAAEAHIGLRKIFDGGNAAFKPYIGAGIALINAEMRSEDKSTGLSRIEEESSTGLWAGVGSYVELGEHFQVGADLRYSEAHVTLFDQERQAGGLLSTVTAGYYW